MFDYYTVDEIKENMRMQSMEILKVEWSILYQKWTSRCKKKS